MTTSFSRCGSHNQTCANLQCATGCVMTSAGPRCYCEDGYQLDQADLATCVDVDECQVNDDACSLWFDLTLTQYLYLDLRGVQPAVHQHRGRAQLQL